MAPGRGDLLKVAPQVGPSGDRRSGARHRPSTGGWGPSGGRRPSHRQHADGQRRDRRRLSGGPAGRRHRQKCKLLSSSVNSNDHLQRTAAATSAFRADFVPIPMLHRLSQSPHRRRQLRYRCRTEVADPAHRNHSPRPSTKRAGARRRGGEHRPWVRLVYCVPTTSFFAASPARPRSAAPGSRAPARFRRSIRSCCTRSCSRLDPRGCRR